MGTHNRKNTLSSNLKLQNQKKEMLENESWSKKSYTG